MNRRSFVISSTTSAIAALAWIRGGVFAAHAADSGSAADIAGALVRAVLPFDDPRFPRIDPESVRQRMYAVFSLDGDASFAAALTLFDTLGAWLSPPTLVLGQEMALYGPPDLAHDAQLYAGWSKTTKAPQPTFTGLNIDDQRSYLRMWSHSSLGMRRRFYRSVKSLIVAAAYSMDALWAAIGYEGPLISRSTPP